MTVRGAPEPRVCHRLHCAPDDPRRLWDTLLALLRAVPRRPRHRWSLPSSIGRGLVVGALLILGCDSPAPKADEPTPSVAKAEPENRSPQVDAVVDSPATGAPVEPAPSEAAEPPPEPEPEPEPEPDPLDGTVRPGDSLSKILHRAGIGAAEVQLVAEALTPVMDPATIRIGQRYEIELDEGGELLSFAFHLTQTEVARVRRHESGTLEGKLETRPTELHEEEIIGEVSSSLWGALTERGHSPALVDVLVDVFAYDIDFFTSTRAGDRFRVIVERHELDGKLVRYGRVLAAEYRGEAVGEAVLLWWEPPGGGKALYVDGDGKGVARTVVKSPLKYARITSGFDPKRMHPVLHRVKSHQGVDYGAPEGTPVWAAADGKIVFRAEKGGAGNMVILRHPGGLKTLYMHLSRFAEGQRVGQEVSAKTVIGYVGQTGLATGPHLHYGMQKNGRYVDPTTIESVRAKGVAKADRARFRRFRDRWLKRLAAIDDGDSEEEAEAGSESGGEVESESDSETGSEPSP